MTSITKWIKSNGLKVGILIVIFIAGAENIFAAKEITPTEQIELLSRDEHAIPSDTPALIELRKRPFPIEKAREYLISENATNNYLAVRLIRRAQENNELSSDELIALIPEIEGIIEKFDGITESFALDIFRRMGTVALPSLRWCVNNGQGHSRYHVLNIIFEIEYPELYEIYHELEIISNKKTDLNTNEVDRIFTYIDKPYEKELTKEEKGMVQRRKRDLIRHGLCSGDPAEYDQEVLKHIITKLKGIMTNRKNEVGLRTTAMSGLMNIVRMHPDMDATSYGIGKLFIRVLSDPSSSFIEKACAITYCRINNYEESIPILQAVADTYDKHIVQGAQTAIREIEVKAGEAGESEGAEGVESLHSSSED